MKKYSFIIFTLLASSFLQAAPVRYQSYSTADQIKETQDSLNDIKREIRNHEHEIKLFEERYANQEQILQSLRDEVKDTSLSHKEHLKTNSSFLDAKLAQVESSNKAILQDLKQYKDKFNELSDAFKQYKDRMAHLERLAEQQQKNQESLESAINSLIEAMNPDSKFVVGGRNYRVKAGDSLEKIARIHKVTVKALKEANQLVKDQIVIGQTLKIPE